MLVPFGSVAWQGPLRDVASITSRNAARSSFVGQTLYFSSSSAGLIVRGAICRVARSTALVAISSPFTAPDSASSACSAAFNTICSGR